MARYIDVGGIKKHIIRDGNLIGERNYITFSELDEIPTADVVEVIRCKDCLFGYRYFDVQNGITDSWVECRNPDGLNRDVSDDGYCCSAIRRKE